MKNIRLGNDISIKWYVYRMNTPEDFNGKTVEVHLLDKNDVKQNFTYKIEDGVISGMFYGKNQMTTGAYRLVLVENAGKPNMVTLDYVDAFILNNKMNNMTSSGYDTAYNMKTNIVNLTSIMSTQSGVTNLHDYYTKFDVDELLNDYAKSVDLQSYAKVKHTHDQYALKTELFSKDYNDLTNKPTIPAEYDDTQVRNLIDSKQDKLSTSQIANLNADHSKYLTEHQTLPDYSTTYANINHTHDQYLTEHQDLSAYALKTDIPDVSDLIAHESDPTVPAYVKSIRQSDIDAWNAATGGVDLSNYVNKSELNAASYITADQVTHPDYSTTYAKINHTHNQYLTEHQDLSAYAKVVDLQSYAKVKHTHDQYALKTDIPDVSDLIAHESDPTVPAYVKSIRQSDIDAWNAATGGVDLSNYVNKSELNAASYITADQVTHPDYSTTYANINHTHNQYLTEHQDLSAYALKTDIPDVSDLIAHESDPTVPAYVKSIRQSDIDAWNAATGGVDLSNYVNKSELNAASYITADQVTHPDYSTTYANINHTHNQYLTEHQDLSAYAKKVDLKSYALKEHTHSEYAKATDLKSYALKTDIPDTSSYLTSESDPTVPAYVKSIRQSDIDAWNAAATGGVDLSNYVTKSELNSASYITANKVKHPDYSSTYAPLVHSHNMYANMNHKHSEYLEYESDPTVPAYVKSIRQTDIAAWNAATTSSVDLSNYITKNDLNAASYITAEQVTHPDYSTTYAPLEHTHNEYLESESDPTVPAYVKSIKQSDIDAWNAATGGVDLSNYITKSELNVASYLTSESDPTVPAYVKSIKQTDIDAWNAATGGVDLSNYITKNDLNTASYITADQVTHPDYSSTYAPLEHNHNEYATLSYLNDKLGSIDTALTNILEA